MSRIPPPRNPPPQSMAQKKAMRAQQRREMAERAEDVALHSKDPSPSSPQGNRLAPIPGLAKAYDDYPRMGPAGRRQQQQHQQHSPPKAGAPGARRRQSLAGPQMAPPPADVAASSSGIGEDGLEYGGGEDLVLTGTRQVPPPGYNSNFHRTPPRGHAEPLPPKRGAGEMMLRALDRQTAAHAPPRHGGVEYEDEALALGSDRLKNEVEVEVEVEITGLETPPAQKPPAQKNLRSPMPQRSPGVTSSPQRGLQQPTPQGSRCPVSSFDIASPNNSHSAGGALAGNSNVFSPSSPAAGHSNTFGSTFNGTGSVGGAVAAGSDNGITVAVRIRPFNRKEVAELLAEQQRRKANPVLNASARLASTVGRHKERQPFGPGHEDLQNTLNGTTNGLGGGGGAGGAAGGTGTFTLTSSGEVVANPLENCNMDLLMDDNNHPVPVMEVQADGKTLVLLDPHVDRCTEFTYDHVFSSFAPSMEIQGLMEAPLSHQAPRLGDTVDYGPGGNGMGPTSTSTSPPLPPLPCGLEVDLTPEQEQQAEAEQNALLHYNSRFDTKDVDYKEYEKPKVRADPKKGVFVTGLTTVEAEGWNDCVRYLRQGDALRTQCSTSMNASSSRSHAIFQLQLIQTDGVVKGHAKTQPAAQRYSKVNLVDLAGSERNSKTESVGKHLTEANSINSSLSALRRVIEAIVTNKKVIPHRESLLTYVLSDNFGGNSRTVMCANVSPHAVNFAETESTLRYATIAKSIRNRARINESPSSRLVRELTDRNKGLQEALTRAPSVEVVRGLESEVQQCHLSIQTLQKSNEELQRALEEKLEQEQKLLRVLRKEQTQKEHWNKEAERHKRQKEKLRSVVRSVAKTHPDFLKGVLVKEGEDGSSLSGSPQQHNSSLLLQSSSQCTRVKGESGNVLKNSAGDVEPFVMDGKIELLDGKNNADVGREERRQLRLHHSSGSMTELRNGIDGGPQQQRAVAAAANASTTHNKRLPLEGGGGRREEQPDEIGEVSRRSLVEVGAPPGARKERRCSSSSANSSTHSKHVQALRSLQNYRGIGAPLSLTALYATDELGKGRQPSQHSASSGSGSLSISALPRQRSSRSDEDARSSEGEHKRKSHSGPLDLKLTPMQKGRRPSGTVAESNNNNKKNNSNSKGCYHTEAFLGAIEKVEHLQRRQAPHSDLPSLENDTEETIPRGLDECERETEEEMLKSSRPTPTKVVAAAGGGGDRHHQRRHHRRRRSSSSSSSSPHKNVSPSAVPTSRVGGVSLTTSEPTPMPSNAYGGEQARRAKSTGSTLHSPHEQTSSNGQEGNGGEVGSAFVFSLSPQPIEASMHMNPNPFHAEVKDKEKHRNVFVVVVYIIVNSSICFVYVVVFCALYPLARHRHNTPTHAFSWSAEHNWIK
eukprot:gene8958-6284_t